MLEFMPSNLLTIFAFFRVQVSDLGKKGWSSLAGSNLSSPQGGYDANGSNNYQSSGLSNSNSYHTNNDWNNDNT